MCGTFQGKTEHIGTFAGGTTDSLTTAGHTGSFSAEKSDYQTLIGYSGN
jgi:hypothetical protein